MTTRERVPSAGVRADQHTLDFLRWIATHTSSYRQAWEVWQTSCPRLSTWEDSFIAGYVRTERRADAPDPVVVLTELGRSLLDGAAPARA